MTGGAQHLHTEMMRAALGLKYSGVERLAALDVPNRVIARLTGGGWVGRMRVEWDSTGDLWQPAPEGGAGEPALILPVFEDGSLPIPPQAGLDPVCPADRYVLVDLVALRTDAPDRWALRRGEGWILGACHLRPRCFVWPDGQIIPDEQRMPERVALFGNPLDWLRGGMAGCCLLDWSDSAVAALKQIGSKRVIEADSEALANALRRAWMDPIDAQERTQIDDARQEASQRRAALPEIVTALPVFEAPDIMEAAE